MTPHTNQPEDQLARDADEDYLASIFRHTVEFSKSGRTPVPHPVRRFPCGLCFQFMTSDPPSRIRRVGRI